MTVRHRPTGRFGILLVVIPRADAAYVRWQDTGLTSLVTLSLCDRNPI